ncbi:hypothetical protein RCO28_19015 [Streptomyces sp. LHD-70]|uniref:hypothetical protein n=1 Tax=Streptomyces sp. LHD-70 TaxID=3072140 RepID=UPI00280C601C|nr:hypothetical protein [Streptomyces sp. LHD-70]MDQ8704564.1 hypothetical protein [Streptomyces sp. LHD-70]
MPSFRVDLSTALVFGATAPQPEMANEQTGEQAMDREADAPLAAVPEVAPGGDRPATAAQRLRIATARANARSRGELL